MRSFYKTTGIGLIAFSSVVFSEDALDLRVSDLEKQMLEVSTKTRKGTYGARFASSYSNIEGFHMEVLGDLLFWKANVGGREYAYSSSNMKPSLPHIPFVGKIEETTFHWNVGFKVGVSCLLPEDFWDLGFFYTRFDTSEKVGKEKDWPEGFMGLTGYLTPALKTSSFFSISYNNLDLDLGKSYFISSRLKFYPFIGLKNSWIDQKQTTSYFIHLKQQDLLSFDSKLSDVCHYWGIGPQAGVVAHWFITERLNFFMQTSSSILYGKYKVIDQYLSEEIKGVDETQKQSSSSIFIRGNTYFLSPFVQFITGFGYQDYIYRDIILIRASLNYEVQYFWRQNEMIKAKGRLKQSYNSLPNSPLMVYLQRTSEDLAFYGLTFSLGISF